VRRWIEAHVEIAGRIEQPHVRPWATVLRVPTPRGAVWFKASRPAFAHEAQVLELLRPLGVDLLPDVIASTAAGWLLLGDAGDRAREHPLDWDALMREYARLQRASSPVVAELLAASAYDNRPEHVRERIEALMQWLPVEVAAALRRQLPYVDDRMARLAASRLPMTVDHGDLHDGNVFACGGRRVLLDWGDSAVAHPFFSLSTDRSAPAAYLEEWAEHAPFGEVEEEASIVAELRFLIRALNSEHVAALSGGDDHLVDLVRRFLGPF
jgi:hypothetical protein